MRDAADCGPDTIPIAAPLTANIWCGTDCYELAVWPGELWDRLPASRRPDDAYPMQGGAWYTLRLTTVSFSAP